MGVGFHLGAVGEEPDLERVRPGEGSHADSSGWVGHVQL
jgi:hypothetical protein